MGTRQMSQFKQHQNFHANIDRIKDSANHGPNSGNICQLDSMFWIHIYSIIRTWFRKRLKNQSTDERATLII